MAYNKLSALLDGLTSAVFVLDDKRRILVANRAAERLFGTKRTSSHSGNHSQLGLDFVRAVRHPECLKAVDKVLAGSHQEQVILSLRMSVPTTYQVNICTLDEGTSPPSGALDEARLVVSFDDISPIREAEKMRSDFVANVSHELRSPLTALTGFIETLKGAAKNDEQARNRFLDIMEAEAQRMKRLISDLLSLSKVEINEYMRPTKRVDVAEIVKRVVTTMSPQAAKQGKVISFQCSSNATIRLPGDADQLTQVFHNLVENALRYGDSNTNVEIKLSQIERSYGLIGPVLAVEVKDQGPGIAAEHLPRLTERFYRIDAGRSRDMGGTGLGLAIVKHILSRHRGRLQIESNVGIGSRFIVLLPLDIK
ncbi:MAG: ATP-binding protein [Hyphomicrobiaceae bacterium]|nr:ATP-binding protein [Hyphomicrobiaceae bacterium]